MLCGGSWIPARSIRGAEAHGGVWVPLASSSAVLFCSWLTPWGQWGWGLTAEALPSCPPLQGQGRSSASSTMMGNTVFLSFAFYSTILILKMYVVAIITGQVRLRKKVCPSFLSLLRPSCLLLGFLYGFTTNPFFFSSCKSQLGFAEAS